MKHNWAENLRTAGQDNNRKFHFAGFIRENGVILGMVLVLIVFGLINHKFFAVKNLVNVLNQSSLLIIMSIGMMFAMSVRAVDLSIAQIAPCVVSGRSVDYCNARLNADYSKHRTDHDKWGGGADFVHASQKGDKGVLFLWDRLHWPYSVPDYFYRNCRFSHPFYPA